MEITREQFMAYEEIRQSGITNMFDVRTVIEESIEESDGYLDKEAVQVIMINFTQLMETYPDVKDDVANGNGNLGLV